MKEDASHGITNNGNGIVGAAHFGQRRAAAHQSGRNVQFQVSVHQLSHCQQLDPVAEFLRIQNVGDIKRVDSVARNIAPMNARPERQMRQNGQLLGGVSAVDVHRRVGLGIAAALCGLERRSVRDPCSSICVSTKLLVPFKMAVSDRIWLADKHWLMLAMIGIPPATEASKAIERPSSRARSNSSGPCSARRALLAVTTSLPLSSSANMIVRAGSSPPNKCATP